uniref:Endoribonuclease YbeY n=2 Tax=Lynx canadensis TaxID=61383 RepID=A0A667GHB6_LYNCA
MFFPDIEINCVAIPAMTQKPAQRTSAPAERPPPDPRRAGNGCRATREVPPPALGGRPRPRPARRTTGARWRGGEMAQGKEAASTQSGPAPRSPSGPGTRRPAACRRPGAPRARLEAQTRTAAAGARPSLRAAERKRNGPTSGPSARLGHTLTPPQSGSALQPEGLRGFRRTGCQRGPLGLEPGSFLNIFKGHVVLKMSLVLRNLQRAVPIRRAPLRKKLEIVRSILGVQKFDLAIVCVDNKSIQHINKIYREKNLPTDVLSFPFHENVKAGELPQPDFPDDYNLGDIFLGVEYIFQQCKGNEDYYDVLTVTATHGLCHLLGFTHSTEAEWQKMYQKEKQVLEELNRRTGTSLQPLSRGLF